MRDRITRLGAALGIVALGLLCRTASATSFSFQETFGPPITPGHDPSQTAGEGGFEDGWLNGEHGWVLNGENFGTSDRANFGENSQDTPGYWPSGVIPIDATHSRTVTNVGNILNISDPNNERTATAAQNFTSTPLTSGNVTLVMCDVLGRFNFGGDEVDLSLKAANGSTVAQLQFGSPTSTNKFQVSQIGGAATIVSDASTTTTDGKPLLWQNNESGNPNNANSDYAILSVDFDVAAQLASVVISTAHGDGSLPSSTAPVIVPFSSVADVISGIVLTTHYVDPNGSTHSVMLLGEVDINGQVQALPEPASLSLIGLSFVTLARRRRAAF